MRALYNVLIGVGSVAAAITGTTVAVKKNDKVGKFYEDKAPKVVKTSCKKVETVSVNSYKKTTGVFSRLWKSNVEAYHTAKNQGMKAAMVQGGVIKDKSKDSKGVVIEGK